MTIDLRVSSGKLRPLPRISPSRYYQLQQCALREVWQANGQPPLLPIFPSARLGSVAHNVLQLAGEGRITEEEDLEDAWESVVSRVEDEMRRTGEEHLVPLRENAPRYEVKKRLALAAATRIIENHRDESTPKGAHAPSVGSEVWLASKDGLVGGYADRIIFDEEGAEILDYKTGAVTDDKTGNVKGAYEIQLLLYAALYHDEHGEWPARLTLSTLDGTRYDVRLDPVRAFGLMEEARARLTEVNNLIAKHAAPDELATPSSGACCFCCYRPACEHYWRARGETPEWPVDITGKVTGLTTLGNGTLRIAIETSNGTVAVRGLSRTRFAFLKNGAASVMLCNLRPETTKGFYTPTRMTKGYARKDEKDKR